MNWFDWLLVADIALGCVYAVSHVGKPRKSITPLEASINVILSGLLIWGVVVYR